MVIGIDIDDTIANTYEVAMSYAQEYTVKELKKEPILKQISCDTHYYIQTLLDWKNGEDLKYLKHYYEKIISESMPKTLAIEYLEKLKSEGNRIVLITARWEADYFDVKKATKEWIEKYNIPCDKLIINAENKLIACKQENVDVFVDDSFSNCKMVSSAGIKTFLMDTRANNNLKCENFERVYSWPHLYMKLSN